MLEFRANSRLHEVELILIGDTGLWYHRFHFFLLQARNQHFYNVKIYGEVARVGAIAIYTFAESDEGPGNLNGLRIYHFESEEE